MSNQFNERIEEFEQTYNKFDHLIMLTEIIKVKDNIYNEVHDLYISAKDIKCKYFELKYILKNNYAISYDNDYVDSDEQLYSYLFRLIDKVKHNDYEIDNIEDVYIIIYTLRERYYKMFMVIKSKNT